MQRLLRERTEAAVEGEGSFGLPWYVGESSHFHTLTIFPIF